jgi:hypothetical protein
MLGGTMKTQNEQWGQSNYEVSKLHIILKPMLLRGTLIFSVYTTVQKKTVLRI